MKWMTVMISLSLGGLVATGPTWGYEEITVNNGGSLTGIVKLLGPTPKPKGYNLVTFPDAVYCGRISDGRGWRLLQPFRVGDNQGFKNVVIQFQKIKRGKPFPNMTPRIEAKDCRFDPYIIIVRNREKINIVNMDPVLHDIQAYETSRLGARVLFNVPLPMSKYLRKEHFLDGASVKKRAGRDMTQKIKMSKGRNIFVMQCGFHAYMESWGLAVKNPYYAVSTDDGTYAITDIPPGTYQVTIWHPMLTKELTVTIKAGKETKLNIDIDAPKGRLYANEVSDNTRFGMELLQGSRITPTVELQKR